MAAASLVAARAVEQTEGVARTVERKAVGSKVAVTGAVTLAAKTVMEAEQKGEAAPVVVVATATVMAKY